MIFTATNPDDASKLTRRLASALEVLGPPVHEGGGVATPLTTVSGKSYLVVAATPEQADRLALAQRDGGNDQRIAVRRAGQQRRNPPGCPAGQCRWLSRGDYPIGERALLGLPPPAGPPAPPERTVVETIRGDKITYVVFTGDDVRLSQEEAVRGKSPAGMANAAAPKSGKKCKKCEEAKQKAAWKSAGAGAAATPGTGPIAPAHTRASRPAAIRRPTRGPGGLEDHVGRSTTKQTKHTKVDQTFRQEDE